VDRYLAKFGYSGQQTDEPRDPGTPTNLGESVPGPYGAHGRFDRQAKAGSLQFWLRSLLP
jgi:hypothetical protein